MIRSNIEPADYEQAQIILQSTMDCLGEKQPTEFQSLIIDNLKRVIDEFRLTMTH
jgi:hypothetical protein